MNNTPSNEKKLVPGTKEFEEAREKALNVASAEKKEFMKFPWGTMPQDEYNKLSDEEKNALLEEAKKVGEGK